MPSNEATNHGSSDNPSVAKSTALMSVATLASRATGLIRTWAMAFALGNTLMTSAYQVANNMPNVIYELMMGGIFGAAFLPVYLLQKEKLGSKGATAFGNNILNICLVVLGAVSILAAIFSDAVISTQTFTVGDSAQVTGYAVWFFRIFAIQIVFYGIGGVVTGILNANRVYFLPSVAPVINNLFCIIAFFAYNPLAAIDNNLALIFLASMTSLGVVFQFIVQIPALRKTGWRWQPRINLHDPALKEALKIALPTLVYVCGTMVAFSCRNAFSLQAGDNGPATLLYAWIWYQLPYGVLAVSISRALFTEMSEAVAKEDWQALRAHTKSGIANTILMIVPLATLMGVLAVPLMSLFRAGAFNSDDVRFVAAILSMWVVSLPFYSVLMLLYNVFASIRRFLVFALVSCGMVVVQALLYALLCSQDVLGLMGVPVADLVYYAGCCIIMIAILQKRIGSIGITSVLSTTLRVIVASAIGAAIAYFLQMVLPFGQNDPGIVTGLIKLVLCGSIGLVVIFGLCAVFRVPEMSVLSGLIARFKRR